MSRTRLVIVTLVTAIMHLLMIPAHAPVVNTAFSLSTNTAVEISTPPANPAVPRPAPHQKLADLPPGCAKDAHRTDASVCIIRETNNYPMLKACLIDFSVSPAGDVPPCYTGRGGKLSGNKSTSVGTYHVGHMDDGYVTQTTKDPKTGLGYPMKHSVFFDWPHGKAIHYSSNFEQDLRHHAEDPSWEMPLSWGCVNIALEKGAINIYKHMKIGSTVNIVMG